MKLTQEEVMNAAIRYQGALKTHAYAMLRDWSAAEDVVQDSLIVVMKKWETFEEGTNIYAWTRKIVRFKTLEKIRSVQKEISVEDRELEAAVENTLNTHLDELSADRQRVMTLALKECMSKLNKKAVNVISDFYTKTFCYEKLADIYGQSVEGIRKMLYRSRKSLRECMLKMKNISEPT